MRPSLMPIAESFYLLRILYCLHPLTAETTSYHSNTPTPTPTPLLCHPRPRYRRRRLGLDTHLRTRMIRSCHRTTPIQYQRTSTSPGPTRST
ncbi:hypothetical protein BDZ97DRAFT_202086 [Flammula alnicola]|nr:hypothetical protein BDZ97DRAFT_202086 [Flammula alnicola]